MTINNPKNVLLSIKPKFALQIIDGTKTIELRRKFPTETVIGGIAVIYASSPLQKIIGYAFIKNVSFLTADKIWSKYGEESKVQKDFFYKYYDNLTHGFAIHLEKPLQLKRQLSLRELKNEYDINPPQSYRYLSTEISKAILL
jgi:predicted transcriptional regulator